MMEVTASVRKNGYESQVAKGELDDAWPNCRGNWGRTRGLWGCAVLKKTNKIQKQTKKNTVPR